MYEIVVIPDTDSSPLLYSLILYDDAVKLVSDSEWLTDIPTATGESSRQVPVV